MDKKTELKFIAELNKNNNNDAGFLAVIDAIINVIRGPNININSKSEYLREKCKDTPPDALYAIAYRYTNATSIKQDESMVKYLYEFAIGKGSIEAIYGFAHCYHKGMC